MLPVQRWTAQAKPGWLSEVWRTRRGHLFLLPGDSPLGFRLPLQSLPYARAGRLPASRAGRPVRRAPAAARSARHSSDQRAARSPDGTGAASSPPLAPETFVVQQAPAATRSRTGGAMPVRTALTVEVRDGRLCVFMPPVETLADYLELLADGRSDRGRRSACPIHVEGYAPPPDPRLNVIKVTPDPGVIEVNIHPAAIVARGGRRSTRALYEEAHLARLGTDKFMLDGRHTGTGGGNHVVLGGREAADSPFLRRPDLLKSLVLYWQRRPSLSYFFSGLFIGPDQPGAAHRRSAPGHALRAGNRARQRAAAAARRCAAAVAGRPAVPQSSWSTSPATPIAPKSASTNCFRRTARPAGSAWSNSARSKCRRTRA